MASKIKVDNIENQCGGAVVTKCGATTTISGSVVKADDIQAADGGNIINQCGTTITLGASGDTINLASGASQTGFGRTGTVDWDTTPKTADFTAVSGDGYFVNTTSGAVTVTLPATPSAGDIVYVKDYTGTFSTNACTVARNGSNIRGAASDFTLEKNNSGGVFIYVDATEGWQVFLDGSDIDATQTYICATGGTITCCGDYKIHTFTGPGTFTVNSLAESPANNSVDYLVVAGGAGAGSDWAGGGGAGGFRESCGGASGCYSTSPLSNPCGALPVAGQGYPITVGGGGAGGSSSCGENPARHGSNGSNSSFSSITSTGGGTGGVEFGSFSGNPGGSGGGSYYTNGNFGTGNTPPTSPPQGNTGGDGPTAGNCGAGGGGGGATAVGTRGGTPSVGGAGGTGATTSISGSATAYAGGGGGNGSTGGAASPCGTGGAGSSSPGSNSGGNGTTNRGGGAGAGGVSEGSGSGGTGGSGVVIIRYRFQ